MNMSRYFIQLRLLFKMVFDEMNGLRNAFKVCHDNTKVNDQAGIENPIVAEFIC